MAAKKPVVTFAHLAEQHAKWAQKYEEDTTDPKSPQYAAQHRMLESDAKAKGDAPAPAWHLKSLSPGIRSGAESAAKRGPAAAPAAPKSAGSSDPHQATLERIGAAKKESGGKSTLNAEEKALRDSGYKGPIDPRGMHDAPGAGNPGGGSMTMSSVFNRSSAEQNPSVIASKLMDRAVELSDKASATGNPVHVEAAVKAYAKAAAQYRAAGDEGGAKWAEQESKYAHGVVGSADEAGGKDAGAAATLARNKAAEKGMEESGPKPPKKDAGAEATIARNKAAEAGMAGSAPKPPKGGKWGATAAAATDKANAATGKANETGTPEDHQAAVAAHAEAGAAQRAAGNEKKAAEHQAIGEKHSEQRGFAADKGGEDLAKDPHQAALEKLGAARAANAEVNARGEKELDAAVKDQKSSMAAASERDKLERNAEKQKAGDAAKGEQDKADAEAADKRVGALKEALRTGVRPGEEGSKDPHQAVLEKLGAARAGGAGGEKEQPKGDVSGDDPKVGDKGSVTLVKLRDIDDEGLRDTIEKQLMAENAGSGEIDPNEPLSVVKDPEGGGFRITATTDLGDEIETLVDKSTADSLKQTGTQRALQTGPRGGSYYESPNGGKVYVRGG